MHRDLGGVHAADVTPEDPADGARAGATDLGGITGVGGIRQPEAHNAESPGISLARTSRAAVANVFPRFDETLHRFRRLPHACGQAGLIANVRSCLHGPTEQLPAHRDRGSNQFGDYVITEQLSPGTEIDRRHEKRQRFNALRRRLQDLGGCVRETGRSAARRSAES